LYKIDKNKRKAQYKYPLKRLIWLLYSLIDRLLKMFGKILCLLAISWPALIFAFPSGDKIVGGTEAYLGQFPYQVFISFVNHSQQTLLFF